MVTGIVAVSSSIRETTGTWIVVVGVAEVGVGKAFAGAETAGSEKVFSGAEIGVGKVFSGAERPGAEKVFSGAEIGVGKVFSGAVRTRTAGSAKVFWPPRGFVVQSGRRDFGDANTDPQYRRNSSQKRTSKAMKIGSCF